MEKCFNCGNNGEGLYGYFICDACKSKLRLFTDSTIKKYYDKSPENYSKDIQRRLDFVDKDYIKKRIKLLHIQEQIKSFEKGKI